MPRFTLALLVACSGGDEIRPRTDGLAPVDPEPSNVPPGGGPGDVDGDGAPTATDCDDADPGTFPDAPERCDGVDQDCDGVVDDGIPTDGSGCVDPGPPADDGVVNTITVTVRTGSAANQGTDNPDPTLCLGEGLCYVLGLADWNDREVGALEVYAFDAGARSRAEFDRFELSETDGEDAWVPTGFEVAFDGVPVYCEDAPGVTFGNGASEVLTWTDPAGLHVDCATVYPSAITHGPIVGPGQSDGEIHLWVRTSSTRRVSMVVAETSAALDTATPVVFGYPLAADDFTFEARLHGITPDRTWFYAIDVDGVRHGPWTFTAPPPAGAPGVRKIAFGSCSRFDEQPTFGSILAYDPDVFLFIGDNHYGNTSDLDSLRQYYRWAHERYGRASLLATTPVMATWDDHDFVGNNTLGVDEPGRDVALRGFGEYWANPSVGSDSVPGVYTRASWGDVDWFLVDDRYHRGEDESMLGLGQEAWLVEAIASSTATFKLVACGSEWSYTGATDSWDEFRGQRERLFQALVDRNVSGVVLMSGDIHRSELRRLAGPVGGYDLPELISSPLANTNSSCPLVEDEELVACYDAGPSYVTLDIDTTIPDPALIASIRDEGGGVVDSWTILHSELVPGQIP